MLKSEAAVELGGFFIIGFGLEAVAAGGDLGEDEVYELRTEPLAAKVFLYIYLLEPDDAAARLLRICVGEDAVARAYSAELEDEGVAVGGAREELLERGRYIPLGDVFKNGGRGIEILYHLKVFRAVTKG